MINHASEMAAFVRVVDSKGFWFQTHDNFMGKAGDSFTHKEILGVSGQNLDNLKIVPFESNAAHHPEVQQYPFRYGLQSGDPILPLPFTARQFFDCF